MNSYSKIKLIFHAMLIFSLSNCVNTQPNISKNLEISFKKVFPIEDMNKSLQITVEDVLATENNNKDTFEFGSEIPIKMLNLSNYQIDLDTQSFIKLFIVRDTELIEIQNKDTYSGELMLSPKGTLLLDFKHTGVRPVLIDNVTKEGEKEILRIVLFGELMQDDVPIGEPVGAYVDVVVK